RQQEPQGSPHREMEQRVLHVRDHSGKGCSPPAGRARRLDGSRVRWLVQQERERAAGRRLEYRGSRSLGWEIRMGTKTPVVLLVLVETARLRWFVAALGLDGQAVPLLRSEEGDLEKYRGLAFDEQVAFLRHRFCGVLQRGCDRLWARDSKACQFAFVF